MNDSVYSRVLSPSAARQIDRVCDRFEAALRAAGLTPAVPWPDPVESLNGFPEPERSSLLRQLLLLDWEYRRRAGDAPSIAEYQSRFPADAAVVEAVAREMTEATVSTQTEGPRTPWPDEPQTETEGETGAGPLGRGLERYELLGEVGHGGIGVVYRGRDRLLGRTLAVKMLADDYRDRPDARRRFLAEARVGSQLQHPAIVPVYELGHCDDGRPFLTMKLVVGHTLAELFRDRRDPTDELPRLLGAFEQVCQAIAYAHGQGIIHRDLKPANVMVGSFGEVQVMDWGFAKILGDDPSEPEAPVRDTDLAGSHSDTRSGALMGTPAYMSPEQARGETALVDRRADVFALGAILCEILTGRPPYGVGSVAEICRRAAAEDLADARARLDACTADMALRDLAKRCLAAAAAARPADAEAVAGEMTAYQASARERLRQAQVAQASAEAWAAAERRGRRLALGLAAALLVGVGVAAWQAVVAYRAQHGAEAAAVAETAAKETAQSKEAEARSVLTFFRDRVLAAPRPKGVEGGQGKDVTILAALDRAEPQIAKAFADRPAVEAAIRHSLAMSYAQLGASKQAVAQQQRALALNRQTLGPEHPDTLGAMNNLAIMLQAQGRSDEARALFEEVVVLKRRVLGPEDPSTMRAVNNLAGVLWNQDRLAEARKLYEEVLPLQRRRQGSENPDTLRTMSNLAMVLRAQGHLKEARSLFEEMLPLQRRTLNAEHPEALSTMNNLALILEDQGKLDEAQKQLEEALDLQRRFLPREHPDTLTTMHNLARLLRDRRRFAEARVLFEETLGLKRRVLPAGHREMLRTLSSYSWMLADAADPKFRDPPRAVAMAKELVQYSPQNGTYRFQLGAAHYRAGQWKEAVAALERSEKQVREQSLAMNQFFLGMAHWQLDEKEKGRRCYDNAADLLAEDESVDPDISRLQAEAAQLLGLTES